MKITRTQLIPFKMDPDRAKQLTGVKAELYVFTFDQLCELAKKLKPEKPAIITGEPMIGTTEARIHDIFKKPFQGHPSREDVAKTTEAIYFLARQIDIIHKLRIQKK